ncbi:asparagine synthase (glutamine-hydrolyzing) [Synechococcus sp. PROS-9-1]|uniref:asparagine synthase (glutamine-hydrolyzing) n=1 Tax=Synechococcus sp. PROS-9-1 TaxID=1968775 RepID=UPI001645CB0B|nr:asparagine synthase (glutamine-hydrolyzing) [Synechococcus sp. PROS-9-1]QNJ30615.1 asparagine synthase (glutamine-hydrolyzing) [Synechococcus sp. PROS-9-1]
MCGIAGVIGLKSSQIAKKLLKKIEHRGPDGSGFWLSSPGEFPATLCHSRLSILDLSDAGAQPFHSANGRYSIVFNGEIYNFLELGQDLTSKYKVSLLSNTDTEVLLYGLIYEGLDFLSKCNGMWAFCLWDRLEARATFSRDRFGVKPLFFADLSGGRIAFSSEMKGLAPLLSSIIPSQHIKDIFAHQFSYEFSDLCAIAGISRLPAGSVGIYENGRLFVDQWWNTLDHLSLIDVDYSSQVDSWRELFFDSVNIRMRSDVRIGTALSGGLDSSSVLAAMSAISGHSAFPNNRVATDWQHGICCSFPGSSLDESHFAKKVAQSCNVNFDSLNVLPNVSEVDIIESLARVDDPYLTMPIPMLATYKAIKSKGISVTLDGHGADELFSGYGHLKYALQCSKTYREFSQIMEIDRSTRTGIFSYKERRNISCRLRCRVYYFLYSLGVLPLGRFRMLLSGVHFNSDYGGPSSRLYEARKYLYNHPRFLELDAFTQVLYEIFHLTILPTLLRNYDRYSMANGLEIRMPFMDWRLVTYTFSLPLQSKLGGTFTKRILRDALSGFLIDEVRLRRDKIGWNAPVHEWFQGPLKQSLDERFANHSSSPYHEKFRYAYLNFLKLHNPGFRDGQQLWNSVLPLLWLESLNSSSWN